MRCYLGVVAVLVALASSGVGAGVVGGRVLVLLENLAVKETHSIYFKWMAEQGFELTFKVADDSSLSLKKFGEPLYEHLVVFAPTVEEFGGGLSLEALTEFVDSGGNVLVAGSSGMGEVLRELASEVGFEADEEGTAVIDHLSHDKKDLGQHTLVVVQPAQAIKCERIVGVVERPLLYRGAGLLLDPENPLVLPILTGSSTSYSHNPEEPVMEFPHAVGKQTVLIAGLQARNNARVVFSGSLEFFSDEFFLASVEKAGSEAVVESGNLALAKSLTLWVLKQNGVLKVEGLSHHKQGEAKTPAFYTIMEQAQYNIQVSELVHGTWEPFKGEDMQMEFVRIDPFVRVTMDNNNGKLTGKFKVPDTYGVYQFKVNYQRLGLTRLSEATQISVVPLRHDQYERFIGSAHPYYASAFSMMAGVFVFAIVFLHFKEESVAEAQKKSQ